MKIFCTRRSLFAKTAVLAAGLIAYLPSLVIPDLAAATTISSPGPISSITISPDLNCAVQYTQDTSPEFFGNTACATLVAVGGVLYGPATIPAGGSATPRTGFTPVSQTVQAGAGTVADPYRITTVVDLGTTGIRLTQVDTYVNGQENYSTSVSLRNGSGAPVSAVIYRAADCYLANSDVGTGAVANGTVACQSAGGRVEQWIPLTAGSNYIEANYNEVWTAVGTRAMFPNTCRCAESIDNGAGLSWQVGLQPGASTVVSHLTAFSPNAQLTDADGDGLPDVWETNGLDTNGDGVIDVDLPAMGASPNHKDLFVEADWMDKPESCVLFICWGGRSFAPDQNALADVRNAFASAPVTNPDGTTGIRLHIDSGPNSIMNPVTSATWGNRSQSNRVNYSHDLGSFAADGTYDWTAFNNLRNANFNGARADVFHYAIFGDRYAGSGSSGITQIQSGRFAADSFLITDGDASWGDGFTRRQESGTFMHEFGHSLGLRHGGDVDTNNKPNYLSIMSYSWQLQGRPLDYSRSKLPDLNEAALSETAGLPGASGPVQWACPNGDSGTGVGGANIDWNCNGAIDQGTVNGDINSDGAIGVLSGYNDWPNLVYDGGAVGAFGAGDLHDQDPEPTFTSADEPTANQFRSMHAYGSNGDGTVRIIGPSVLVPSVTGQSVRVNVTNVGTAAADYQLSLAGLPTTPAPVTVHVQGGATSVVAVPVDASALVASTPLDITATLTAPSSSYVLSSDTIHVVVPDMTDPAVRSDVTNILSQLQNPQPGLDDAVRAAISSSLRTGMDNAVPSAPRNVTATAADASATVNWTAPASSGSGPITGYRVTSQPGNIVVNVGASATTANVTGLTNGTSYTFVVTASNGVGLGAPSAPSNAVTPGQSSTGPVLDRQVSADVTAGSTGVTSPSLTTSGPGELLLAFVSADGPATSGQSVNAVSGGGLTWTKAAGSDSWGSAEVWQAYATNTFTGTVSAQWTKAPFDGSITVAAFKGTRGVGAIANTSGFGHNATASVVTTKANSLVWAVGHDWDNATTRTFLAINQRMEHQFIDTRVRDTFWVQSYTAKVGAGATVTASTGVSSDGHWQLAAVEIPAG